MQTRNNCHKHVWLLTGTGDGYLLAQSFIANGWKVSVSIVSYQAGLPYSDLPLEELWVGPLEGKEGIKAFFEKSKAPWVN